ncbi:hypothetical protein OZL92_19210 [Bacillus sonorensis]|uniref:Uncharacterized protein n=2 Tax=Bacillus sonorensis TaxID=119858 RepID=M5P7B3_9BACI|nr:MULTISPECIES: DUF6773 family protein [Bacillus]TWK72604.1 hypothetical protein CHCC20335_1269 [Bacillus paralicheniformis]ASB90340.1 uncharacterized protein S101395_03834 [Bacillus sonorensis]EME75886.1 hypothetical protein BSONL12_02889 [Bacillus sonorensis L12]MCF7619583.1 hypothetical protein [Bacillus sonorensis]MCY7855946.1 hypothetical protein [Bacillus sonorensis]
MMKWFASADEYIEKRMTQFFSEAGILIAVLLLMDVVIRGAVLRRDLSEYIVSAAVLGIYIVYVLFRYLLSGMEYTDIDNDGTYRKKRKQVLYGSIVWAAVVLFADIIFTGLPSGAREWGSLILFGLLVVLFCYLISLVSLNKSFKRNKDLLDD